MPVLTPDELYQLHMRREASMKRAYGFSRSRPLKDLRPERREEYARHSAEFHRNEEEIVTYLRQQSQPGKLPGSRSLWLTADRLHFVEVDDITGLPVHLAYYDVEHFTQSFLYDYGSKRQRA
jgi:hypothetical protein